MITVIQNNNIYEIRFPYDPVLIELVKNVPGRWWEDKQKMWTIPKDKLGFLINQLKGTPYESQLYIQSNENLNKNETLDATTVIPDIDISDVNFRVADGLYPFKHQLDCMRFTKWRQQNGYKSGYILGDQPGCGKTLQVMNVGLYNRDRKKSKHCLIICCVNTAKYNWEADILKHTNGEEVPYVLGTRFKRDKVTKRYDTVSADKLKDLQTGHMYGDVNQPELPYFLIVNIEVFRMKQGKVYSFTKEIIKWINEGKIDLIAIDEIHKNASPSSMQGQQLLKIKQGISQPVEWIPMTGTPITSRPTDVFLPLRLIDGHNNNSYYMWCKEFCVYGGFGNHEIVGYKNIDKLKAMLQPNMLRRLKKDVLDLPPKLYHTEYIENTEYQRKLYKQFQEEIKKSRKSIITAINPMVEFLKLRQINGSPELIDVHCNIEDSGYLAKNAKLARLIELVDEIVSNGEKVIIFSNWVEPLRTLYKFISKRYKTCCYTGTMKADVREKHKQVFMTNPNYPIILGTVGALGTSHTLTAASNIIFYDEPWNPTDREQCEDRGHRPGMTQNLNIYTLITKNTVDENVHKILSKKEGVANYIVDGELDIRNHPELFDIILGL